MTRSAAVATHGHCFDGMASAAVFSHLLGKLHEDPAIEFRYRSCGYGPQMGAMPEAWLDGDDAAILDFRYTASARLTWYFDHHVTAFASDTERDRALAESLPPDAGMSTADAGAKGAHVFYDPTYGSCTKLIDDVARRVYGVEAPALSELVRWADIIDAARFSSAEAAVSRAEPVMQLASVVEHHGDTPFLQGIVPRLLQQSVSELARSADIQEKWQPLAAAHDTFVARVSEATKLVGEVAFADLSAAPLEAAGKFVTYALYPTCLYSVLLSRGKQQLKVSVGYNPWSGKQRRHDISAICRRHGGGGHPAVGAFALPTRAIAKAREAAEAIVRELNET